MKHSTKLAPFQWADYFKTGFDEVDHQHHKLVDLVNALAHRAGEGAVLSDEELDHVLAGLGQYARHHFGTEEAMMESEGVDPRHTNAHRQVHQDFVDQVSALRRTTARPEVLGQLYQFVSSWLAFHILDTDQSMARQICAIRQGKSAAQAYEQEERGSTDPANTALIAAVHTLLAVVAERNAALTHINSELEQRVTERTRALAQTQEQLREADKLAAVGQLAAGVAHEINNPVGFVASNLSTLAAYTERLLGLADTADALATADPRWLAARQSVDTRFIREDLPGLVSDSSAGLKRISEIVRALQDFASPQEDARSPVDLNQILTEAADEAAAALGPGQTIQRQLSTTPPLSASGTLLRQVFRAILDNGIRALEGRAGHVGLRSTLADGGVRIHLTDTGCGMDKALRARIFEPFFTTRAVGQGRGLGLASAYRIVQQHGGRIEVHSLPGKGSDFQVWLPLPADA